MFPKLPVLLLLLLTLLLIVRRSGLSFPILLLLASAFFSKLSWDILGVTVRYEQLACLLLFVSILWEIYLKKRRAHFHFFVWLVLALIPFTFLSSLFVSPAPIYSLKKSLLYLPYFCGFYALFLNLDSREKLIRAWDFFYLCGGWVITFSIPFFFLQILNFDVEMVRVRMGNLWLTGPLVIANIFGSTAAIIFIIALVRIMKRLPEKSVRWFDYLFLAASVSGVMLSYTRSSMLGILLGFILVLPAMFRIMPIKKIIMPFILSIAISGVFAGTMFFGQKEASRIYFGSLPQSVYTPKSGFGKFTSQKIRNSPSFAWKMFVAHKEDRRNYVTSKKIWFSPSFPNKMFVGQKEDRGNYAASKETPSSTPLSRKRFGGQKDEHRNYAASKITASSSSFILDKFSNFFGRSHGWESRYQVFLSAFKNWQINPLLGMGSESLLAKNGYDVTYYISSTWLTILHDWGIVALLLHLFFLLLLFSGLVKIFFRSKDGAARELSLSLIAVLIVSTLIYQSTTTMQLAIFWILLAFFGSVVWQFSIPLAKKP
jgi:hypothetical protein